MRPARADPAGVGVGGARPSSPPLPPAPGAGRLPAVGGLGSMPYLAAVVGRTAPGSTAGSSQGVAPPSLPGARHPATPPRRSPVPSPLDAVAAAEAGGSGGGGAGQLVPQVPSPPSSSKPSARSVHHHHFLHAPVSAGTSPSGSGVAAGASSPHLSLAATLARAVGESSSSSPLASAATGEPLVAHRPRAGVEPGVEEPDIATRGLRAELEVARATIRRIRAERAAALQDARAFRELLDTAVQRHREREAEAAAWRVRADMVPHLKAALYEAQAQNSQLRRQLHDAHHGTDSLLDSLRTELEKEHDVAARCARNAAAVAEENVALRGLLGLELALSSSSRA